MTDEEDMHGFRISSDLIVITFFQFDGFHYLFEMCQY